MSDEEKFFLPHPDAAEDEVYLANISSNDLDRCVYKTKRLGSTARCLGPDGNFIPAFLTQQAKLCPLFVKKRDMIEHGYLKP